MRYERFSDEIEAFKDARAVREASAAALVDAAFRDILAGNVDSINVHRALKLATHERHAELEQLRADAERVARHSGARR